MGERNLYKEGKGCQELEVLTESSTVFISDQCGHFLNLRARCSYSKFLVPYEPKDLCD